MVTAIDRLMFQDPVRGEHRRHWLTVSVLDPSLSWLAMGSGLGWNVNFFP